MQDKVQKRILILTADVGFGHRSAANAVAAAMKEKMICLPALTSAQELTWEP